MTRVTAAAARKDFTGTVDRVTRKGERIVLQRRGKDVAAIVPVEELERLRELAALPRSAQARVRAKIDALAGEPRPPAPTYPRSTIVLASTTHR